MNRGQGMSRERCWSCWLPAELQAQTCFKGIRRRVNTPEHSTFSSGIHTCSRLSTAHTSKHAHEHRSTRKYTRIFKMADAPGDRMLIGPPWGIIPVAKTTLSVGWNSPSSPWLLNYPLAETWVGEKDPLDPSQGRGCGGMQYPQG